MTSDAGTSAPRVFLADPRPEALGAWQTNLERETGWRVTGAACDLAGLVAAMPREDVDVFLVATALLAVLPLRSRTAAALGNPEALIVACAEGPDWTELHAALDRGACDVVVPGESAGAWQGRIYRRWAEARERRRLLRQRLELDTAVPPLNSPAVDETRTNTIAICGGDGGTGKTLIAVQLAGMLALHAAALVCLVDFDLPYAAMSILLRQPDAHERCLADIIPVLPELAWQHVSSVLQTHPAGFDLLAGPAPEVSGPDARKVAERLLDVLRDRYEAVIFDWPALDAATVAEETFDQIYVVATPDRCSAHCARALAGQLGLPDGRPSLIVNQCDRPGALAVPEMERLSGLSAAGAIPEDAGMGRLFEEGGSVFAERTDLAVVRAMVAPAQRIVPFEALKQPRHLWQKRAK